MTGPHSSLSCPPFELSNGPVKRYTKGKLTMSEQPARLRPSHLPGALLTLYQRCRLHRADLRAWVDDETPEFDQRLLAATVLDKATPFFVARHMVEVLLHAQTTLPSSGFAAHDLPAPNGVAFLDHAFRVTDEEAPGNSADHEELLLGWRVFGPSEGPWPDRFPAGGVQVQAFTRYPDEELFAVEQLCFLRFSEDPDQVQVAIGTGAGDGTTTVRMDLLRALCFVLRQPVLAEIDELGVDRATRKRYAREYRDPPAVRVISLRHPDPAAAGAADTTWHHTWMVRGHWRQQYYPSITGHRPIWIAPHVKGPEGKPLLGGDTVYHVDR